MCELQVQVEWWGQGICWVLAEWGEYGVSMEGGQGRGPKGGRILAGVEGRRGAHGAVDVFVMFWCICIRNS